MQLETLAFTSSTRLGSTAASSPAATSPRLPPPPLATKRARQNLGATNRSVAPPAQRSPRARKPFAPLRETDPHARMPYVSPRRLKAMLHDDGTARIHDTFRSFDWNGSGTIDRKELREVLQELRLPCDGARVRAALRKYDEDGVMPAASTSASSTTPPPPPSPPRPPPPPPGSNTLDKGEFTKLVFEHVDTPVAFSVLSCIVTNVCMAC